MRQPKKRKKKWYIQWNKKYTKEWRIIHYPTYKGRKNLRGGALLGERGRGSAWWDKREMGRAQQGFSGCLCWFWWQKETGVAGERVTWEGLHRQVDFCCALNQQKVSSTKLGFPSLRTLACYFKELLTSLSFGITNQLIQDLHMYLLIIFCTFTGLLVKFQTYSKSDPHKKLQ